MYLIYRQETVGASSSPPAAVVKPVNLSNSFHTIVYNYSTGARMNVNGVLIVELWTHYGLVLRWMSKFGRVIIRLFFVFPIIRIGF